MVNSIANIGSTGGGGTGSTEAAVTVDDVVLSGVTRVNGSGGWNAPSKKTEEGFEYDSYVEAEPLEAEIEAWVDDAELERLQNLRSSGEPFPASIDAIALSKAKLEDLSVEREGRIQSHRKATIQLAEVREATLGTAEISISTPEGDMGAAAEGASPSVAQPQGDDTGTTEQTTNSNGVANFLSDIESGLQGLF